MSLEMLSVLLSQLWEMWEVRWIVSQVLFNVVVAVAAAVSTGKFELAKLGEFLFKKLLPILAVFAVSKAMSDEIGVPGMVTTTWTLMVTMLVAQVVPNLKALGIPIPDSWIEYLQRENA